jgi:hypothetical protein
MGGSSTEIPESPLSREEAAIAKQQYQDYQARWAPVIQFYKSRIDKDVGAKRALAKGQTNADIKTSFGRAGQQVNQSLRGQGIATGSGRDIVARAGLSNAEAAASGTGSARDDAAIDAQYLQGIQQIVGIGRNQRVAADTSLSTLSGLSGKAAEANAQAAAARAAGRGEAIGTGIGVAGSAGYDYLSKSVPKKPDTGSGLGLPAPQNNSSNYTSPWAAGVAGYGDNSPGVI